MLDDILADEKYLHIEADMVLKALDPKQFVQIRTVTGGPGQSAMKKMLAEREKRMQAYQARRKEMKDTLAFGEKHLKSALEKYRCI